MAEIISSHAQPIHPSILRLFETVIVARTNVYHDFQRQAAFDLRIRKGNYTHKFFIDVLLRAYQILGGERLTTSRTDAKDETTESAREMLPGNRFAVLALDDEEDDRDEATAEERATTHPPTRTKSRPGNGKSKGKKARRHWPASDDHPRVEGWADDLDDLSSETFDDHHVLD